MRDIIDNSVKRLKRCMASIVHEDFDAVIEECNAAEEKHWSFDFFRGLALHGKGDFLEAEEAWCSADAHYNAPRFPLSPSNLASPYMARISVEQKNYLNARCYISRFLSAGNNDDIFGLYTRGQLTATLAEGIDDETLRIDHFNVAINDLQQAYTLLRSLPDKQFYLFKCLRDMAETDYDEVVSLYEDVADTSFISNFLSQFTSIVNADDAPVLEASTLFGAVMPADPIRIEIGLALVRTLAEIDDSPLDEVLTLLEELSSVACRDCKFSSEHTFIRLVIVQVHIDMHNEQSDSNNNDHLQEAESVFDDALRLAYQHQIYDTFSRLIKNIETQIERLQITKKGDLKQCESQH